jgi:hypothetical protein
VGTYFCLFLVELRGLWAHLTSISHLTSKPTHNASRHPARWRQWEDAWYRAQEAWPRCRLQAYAGGGYVVACRRFRLRVNPPAKKFDQNPLIKWSRNAIPQPFQPKPSRPTYDCHVFRGCTARSKNEGDPTTPPPNEYCRFSLLNDKPLRLPPAVRAHTPAHTGLLSCFWG